jgi:DNA-binding response OmpR family regulator
MVTAPTTPPNPDKPSVLVVEDDPIAAKVLERLLEHYEYEVETAGTVRDAMAALCRRDPNYVLLDLMLPDGCGTTVLERIREKRMRARVAVITGSNDRETVIKVARLAPQAVLKKPVTFLQILELLKSAA